MIFLVDIMRVRNAVALSWASSIENEPLCSEVLPLPPPDMVWNGPGKETQEIAAS